MRKDKEKDCALSLIGLVDKPKAWRLEASKVLIQCENRIGRLEWETAAVLGLVGALVALAIKAALGL